MLVRGHELSFDNNNNLSVGTWKSTSSFQLLLLIFSEVGFLTRSEYMSNFCFHRRTANLATYISGILFSTTEKTKALRKTNLFLSVTHTLLRAHTLSGKLHKLLVAVISGRVRRKMYLSLF